MNDKNKIHKNFSSYNNILSIIANRMIKIKSPNFKANKEKLKKFIKIFIK